MNRTDWLLFTIGCVGDDYLSPVQLQKCLFLLSKKKLTRGGSNYYKFIPYNYGPFCKDIYLDAEKLASEGLINLKRVTGHSWAGYSLSTEGKKYFKILKENIEKNRYKKCKELIASIKRLSFLRLLSFIYKKYPQYKINSVFPNV